ncbi:hypothetical protein [Nocardia sp. NPDC055049]
MPIRLDAKDACHALDDLKCLVESVAKVVLDINGTPPASNDDFQPIVTNAQTRHLQFARRSTAGCQL